MQLYHIFKKLQILYNVIFNIFLNFKNFEYVSILAEKLVLLIN